MKLAVSPLAEHDLEVISDWIAQDNLVHAISFTEELYQQHLLIAESPVLYRKGPELGAGIRDCSYGRYLLLFRVLDIEVRIEHTVRDSQGINRVLVEPDGKPSDHSRQPQTRSVR